MVRTIIHIISLILVLELSANAQDIDFICQDIQAYCNDPGIFDLEHGRTLKVDFEYPIHVCDSFGDDHTFIPMYVEGCVKEGERVFDLQVNLDGIFRDRYFKSVKLHTPIALHSKGVPEVLELLPFGEGLGNSNSFNVSNTSAINQLIKNPTLMASDFITEDLGHESTCFRGGDISNNVDDYGKTWYLEIYSNHKNHLFNASAITNLSIELVLGYANPITFESEEIISAELVEESLRQSSCLDGEFSNAILSRTFNFVDTNSNAQTCTQEIEILPFPLENLVLPKDLLLDCSEREQLAELALSEIEPIFGCDLFSESNSTFSDLCNVNISYSDEVLEDCNKNQSILRIWNIIRLCSSEVIEHVQKIEFKDTEAPQLVEDELIIALEENCEVRLSLDDFNILENCSVIDEAIVYVVLSGNPYLGNEVMDTINLNEEDYVFMPLKEEYEFSLLVLTDACGNSSESRFSFQVVDQAAPRLSCTESITIYSNVLGISTLAFKDLNIDVHDCSAFELNYYSESCNVVVRDETFIFSNCNKATASIRMLARDALGNETSCTTTVNITKPIVTAPNIPDIPVPEEGDIFNIKNTQAHKTSLENDIEVMLSPNPFSNFINVVHTSSEPQSIEITIWSSNGIQVYANQFESSLGENTFQIYTDEIKQWSKTFLVKVSTQEKTETFKMISAN